MRNILKYIRLHMSFIQYNLFIQLYIISYNTLQFKIVGKFNGLLRLYMPLKICNFSFSWQNLVKAFQKGVCGICSSKDFVYHVFYAETSNHKQLLTAAKSRKVYRANLRNICYALNAFWFHAYHSVSQDQKKGNCAILFKSL